MIQFSSEGEFYMPLNSNLKRFSVQKVVINDRVIGWRAIAKAKKGRELRTRFIPYCKESALPKILKRYFPEFNTKKNSRFFGNITEEKNLWFHNFGWGRKSQDGKDFVPSKLLDINNNKAEVSKNISEPGHYIHDFDFLCDEKFFNNTETN